MNDQTRPGGLMQDVRGDQIEILKQVSRGNELLAEVSGRLALVSQRVEGQGEAMAEFRQALNVTAERVRSLELSAASTAAHQQDLAAIRGELTGIRQAQSTLCAALETRVRDLESSRARTDVVTGGAAHVGKSFAASIVSAIVAAIVAVLFVSSKGAG